jgi:hypothetical protein
MKVTVAAVSAGAEKVSDFSITALLSGSPTGIAVQIGAFALIAAVKVLTEELYAQASGIEGKLDAIIAEPLLTARQILNEVAQINIRSREEQKECDRQLANAFDGLRRAYSYAIKQESDQIEQIRPYLALVSALKEGGKPFADLYIGEFRRRGEDETRKAADARRASDSCDPDFFERHREDVTRSAIDQGHYYLLQVSVDEAIEIEKRRKQEFLEEAAISERNAIRIEGFCRFVELVASNRARILAINR